VRDRSVFAWALVPWRLVLLTEGLFIVVTALSLHGGTNLLRSVLHESTLLNTFIAAGTSNVANNLPAYLALESALPRSSPNQLLPVLIGTNAGPLILLWGSLATLLWRERLRARDVHVSARTFALVGLGGVPLILLSSWATLQLTR
jgi:arsenical pump membrane protein